MIYCDQAAAMRPDPEAIAFYARCCQENFANPEAIHYGASALRRELEEAGEELARSITGSDRYTAFWSNSGTGAFLLLEYSGILQDKKVLSSRLEHPALLAMLKRSATSVELLSCDRRGILETPRNILADFAAFHAVQSELGVRQDLKALFAALPSSCIRFADAIQAAGKLELDFEADFIAVSGVKFGAPGGGALLMRKDFPGAKKFVERIRNSRHPEYTAERISPAAALTLAFTAKRRAERRQAELKRMRELNSFLRGELGNIPGLELSVPAENSSPYILHCRLPRKQGAVVVRILSEAGIWAGAGSACSAESDEGSPALRAIGLSAKESFSGLRFSFGFDLTMKEARFIAEKTAEALKNY